VGQLPRGSTSESRHQALRSIVGEAAALDVLPWIDAKQWWDQVLTNHLYAGTHVSGLNRLILEKSGAFHPDMIWVDRGLHLWPETLQAVRAQGARTLVHFSPDNHRILGNQSRHYFEGIPLYDVHVTTKTDNLDWLRRCGAPRVEFMGKAFDPEIHRPLSLSPQDREKFGCDIGFVGHWEPARERLLLGLQRRGYRLKVWGGGWQRVRDTRNPLFADCPHLVGDDYAKAIGGAKINLCLLSEWFQDKTTARSVEIPACGTFMLAERNEEHQALFKEGVEAEFYSDREELLKKIDYYLQHDLERQAIAQAGRARCLNGYGNEDRLRDVLNRIVKRS